MSEMTNEEGQPQNFEGYSLKRYDLLGVGFRTLGNVVGAISGGFHMLAQEFFAAAIAERKIDAEIQEQVRFASETYDAIHRLTARGDS